MQMHYEDFGVHLHFTFRRVVCVCSRENRSKYPFTKALVFIFPLPFHLPRGAVVVTADRS